jgi:hypothetical protein
MVAEYVMSRELSNLDGGTEFFGFVAASSSDGGFRKFSDNFEDASSHRSCAGPRRLRARLTERALGLKPRAPAEPDAKSVFDPATWNGVRRRRSRPA